jgi:hypothetical protein
MLFRFGSVHRNLGWLLTLLGTAALVVGGRGYMMGAAVRPGWIVAGLAGIVAGTALIRWARRAGPE